MKITNKIRKTVIANKTEKAGNFLAKGLGLMFRGGIGEDEGLLMEFGRPSKNYTIWMLGMRFPIDIIFIGEDRKVTDVYSNVPPLSFRPSTWKVYKPTKPVKWILELRSGRCKGSGTKVGDILDFS